MMNTNACDGHTFIKLDGAVYVTEKIGAKIAEHAMFAIEWEPVALQ